MMSLLTALRYEPDELGAPSNGESPDAIIEELSRMGTSTVYEGSDVDCLLAPRLGPVWSGARIAGPAFTVRLRPSDNLGVRQGVRAAPSGSVLVVDGEGLEFGYVGEVLARIAAVRGLAGLVIDGCVKDVDILRSLAFPVFATGVCLRQPSAEHPGVLGESVTVGDRTVHTGDVVLADTDGILVVSRERLSPALEGASARWRRKQARIASISAGVIAPVRSDTES